MAWVLDQMAEKDCAEILQNLINQAKAGDVQAMKFILDRYWPAPKARIVRFELPAIESTSDIPKALDAVLSAVAHGDLTPEEGLSVASLIEQQEKALAQAEELKRQLAKEAVDGEDPIAKLDEMLATMAERSKTPSP